MAIFLISAPSGTGKTTLMRQLKNQLGNRVMYESVSVTTRPKREGEIEGKDYYFVDKDKFNELLNSNQLCENVTYGSNYYGLTKDELNKTDIQHTYAIVEYEGYKQIKAIYPDAIGVFLTMSKEDCMANMLLRGDSMENANKRIGNYDSEIAKSTHYDYVVKNVRGREMEIISILKGIVKANTLHMQGF